MKKLIYILTALIALASCTDDIIAPNDTNSSSDSFLLDDCMVSFTYKLPGSDNDYDIDALLNGFNTVGGGMTISNENGSDHLSFIIHNNYIDKKDFEDLVSFDIYQSSCKEYSALSMSGHYCSASEGLVYIYGLNGADNSNYKFKSFELREDERTSSFYLSVTGIEINGQSCDLLIHCKPSEE